MYNEDYDYYPEQHQRNMHYEKPMHGPPGPRGPPGGPHGPPGGPHGPPGGPHGPSRGPHGPQGGPHGMQGGPHGPQGGGGPHGPQGGPHGPPMMRGPPRRMMPPDRRMMPPEQFENDYPPQPPPPRGMRGPPSQAGPRGPPGPHFGNPPQFCSPQFGSRQPQQGMPPGKSGPHFPPQNQNRPMIPPFPPPNFGPGGGQPNGPGGPPSGNQNRNASSNNHSQNNMNAPSNNLPIDFSEEIWVETSSADGKVYYYNARSRESAWVKPENVKILHQGQIAALAAASGNSIDLKDNENKNSSANQMAPPNQFPFVPMQAMPMGPMPAMLPNFFGLGPPPPFAMPPPMSSGYPYVMPGMPPPAFPVPLATGATNTNSGGVVSPNNVSATEIKAEVETDSNSTNPDDFWSEHSAADGAVYFFNSVTKESTWIRPLALVKANEKATASTTDEIEESKVTENDSSNAEGSSNMEVDGEGDQKECLSDNKETEEVIDSDDNSNKMEIQENGTEINTEEEKITDNEVTSTVRDDDKKSAILEEEVQKPVDKTRPVSCTPISGSPWTVIWTGDNRVFYFNPSNRLSVWTRPPELKDRSDVDDLVKCPPSKNSPGKEKIDKNESDSPPDSKKIKLEESEEENMKIKAQESTDAKTTITPGKESAIEAEVNAAKERAKLELNVRIQLFRDLLVEKNVSAFSTWEKELHKIVFHPHYLLLTSKDRKQVFEKYVKERVEEERNEKRKKMRERKDDFKKLLEEAGITAKTTFSDFAQKYGKDDRFKIIEKMRERENMFNDYISDLRRKERDERSSIRDRAKKDFIELLKESKLDKHSRWSDVKKSLSDDPRYKAVDSSSLREEFFKEYVKNNISRDTEDEESKERDKRDRVEASIREREKEVQRTLSTHLRERDKERELHKHEEAIQHFKALLTDLVRSPDVSWHEVKKILRKDHRYDAVLGLEREEREKVFDEHISYLYRKKKEKFRELLDETPEITLTSTWKEVKKLFKDDPRCSKFSSSDRKCEKEFKEYLKDKMVTAKADFRELLKETKIITHKSRKLIDESDHLHDIEKVLQNDKRYLVLECIADERRELLMAYIDTLDRKGPPPPPTASEPSRRSTK